MAEDIAQMLRRSSDHYIVTAVIDALDQISVWLQFYGTPIWYQNANVARVFSNPVGRPVETDVHLPYVRFLMEVMQYGRRGVIRDTRNVQRM